MASASCRPPLRVMRSESIAAVLMQVFHDQRRDFGAAESHLQAHRQNGPVAQALHRVFSSGLSSSFAASALENASVDAFPAVDGGALDFRNRILLGMPWRTRCLNRLESAASLRRTVDAAPSVDLAHDALPGDDGAMVHLAQLLIGADRQRPHEVPHVLLVGAAGAFAFLLGKPDVFFGDVGQRRNGGNGLAGALQNSGRKHGGG
jgi:hypothetical protein